MASTELPQLSIPHNGLINHITKNPTTPIPDLLAPFIKYEAKLRELYAQEPTNPVLNDPYLNTLPLFAPDTPSVKTRARDLAIESSTEKERYIMALPDSKRRPTGSPAVVESLKEFRNNLAIFSESSLVDLDWSNVVAAGSSVVNCLLPVPEENKTTKRALRSFFHEKFCPASDVDLFLYGLSEEDALKKIEQIEVNIRDAILSETTVVRTKNAITICSQYPTRHVQIVLRVYKSISEILTGFDIDCSTAAYDGEQVYCTPRALASYITQINQIDMTRRSPSYENRLSKYSRRNFEVYWPDLDRSHIDPTIFERSFGRTRGLARLLVLERLPTANARDEYLRKRREERGLHNMGSRIDHKLRGNIKDSYEDEIAEWDNEDEVSNYHTFTIPYGPKFHAKKIEKLCYVRDLLLNAEWNQPDDREVYLHRHPTFFGRVQDIFQDCCGFCPKPVTAEEIEIAEKESETYVSGNISFLVDDPGRQNIGSFNPLTDDDWTDMAYVGNTELFCQDIVDGNVEQVQAWLSHDGNDPNQRDHTGRTPLHLAVTSSSPEVVKCIVDHSGRLIARLVDGRTALHLAAARGNLDIVKILLEKSSANEAEEEEKADIRRKTRDASAPKESQAGKTDGTSPAADKGPEKDDDDDLEMIDADSNDESEIQSLATGSFIKIDKDENTDNAETGVGTDDDQNDPDFYKIDVVAWDSHCSAMHYAILGGHTDVVKLLCQEYAADILSPVKLEKNSGHSTPPVALTMVLALVLPLERAVAMVRTLLELGTSSSQADSNCITAFHRYVQQASPELVEILLREDKIGTKAAINHLAMDYQVISPLMSAIDRGDSALVVQLLEAGAKSEVDFDTWLKGMKTSSHSRILGDFQSNQEKWKTGTEQPLIVAIQSDSPEIAIKLLDGGANPDTITTRSHDLIVRDFLRAWDKGSSALDLVRTKIGKLQGSENEDLKDTSCPCGLPSCDMCPKPQRPRKTDESLQAFAKESYQYWVVAEDVKHKNNDAQAEIDEYEKKVQGIVEHPGYQLKKAAIADLIAKLERVQEALLQKGAKTFRDLYPDIQNPNGDTANPKEDVEPYKYKFDFSGVEDVTEVRIAAYIELFEAAWCGDLDKIKSLTLTSWGPDGEEPPLQIAVRDMSQNNPFSLALYRGHIDVARAVLEIVQAQWVPKEEKKRLYRVSTGEEEEYDEDKEIYDDDASDDDVSGTGMVFSEIVDDKFTVENIGQVSMKVKCAINALDLLEWTTKVTSLDDGGLRTSTDGITPFSLVIRENDMDRYKFLVEMAMQWTKKISTENSSQAYEPSQIYHTPNYHFEEAIEYGRIEILTETVQRGAGIPLEHLVKQTGVEMKVKPRYYQGLTVYGKKRADWANAGRGVSFSKTDNERAPLLTAALRGCLKSVEWFASETPKKLYLEFCGSKAVKEEPRLKHLNQAPSGVERAIVKWLGGQSNLVIHSAVLADVESEEVCEIIKFLAERFPASLEAKNSAGYTPLFLAYLLGRVEFAKVLVAAGANQTARDKEGKNILHAALENKPDVTRLGTLLSLLDPELASQSLALERNRLSCGGHTPLQSWLLDPKAYDRVGRDRNILSIEHAVSVLEHLLSVSKGADLDILSGSGDTVLHSAMAQKLNPKLLRVLLNHDALTNNIRLFRENAVGRTPVEVAYDAYVSGWVSPPNDYYSSQAPLVSNVELQSKFNNVVDNLLERDLGSFVSTGFDAVQSKAMRSPGRNQEGNPMEEQWALVREFQAKAPRDCKRRLVSLNEANEVARRLGERYSWQRYMKKGAAGSNEREGSRGSEDGEEGEEGERRRDDRDFVEWMYISMT